MISFLAGLVLCYLDKRADTKLQTVSDEKGKSLTSHLMKTPFNLDLSVFKFTHSSTIFLTLKAPITTAAADSLEYFTLLFRKIRLDISCQSSARQKINIKHEALLSSKDKSKKRKKKKKEMK